MNTIKPTNLMGKTLSIALILILTMSTAIAILPTIKAQTTSNPAGVPGPSLGANGIWNIPTYSGLTVSPNPVGVGQPVAVIMIVELIPPETGDEAVTTTVGSFLGYMLSITYPDGTNTTLGPYGSDTSGTHQITFVPTTVGTYTLQFSWPGVLNSENSYSEGTPANFLASASPPETLVVQEAPVSGYTEAPVPLPTQYWTMSDPNAQNRAWNSISGPWLVAGYNQTGAYNPYTYAPMSAHILWTQLPIVNEEGLIGGQYGSLSFGGTSGVTGSGYPEVGLNSKGSEVEMGGYVYYNAVQTVLPGIQNPTTGLVAGLSNVTNIIENTITCMNLQTGQKVWTVPGQFTCGQILDWRSQQQRMTFPYLWYISTGKYQMYDATNGQLLAQWGPYVIPKGNPSAATGQAAVGETIQPYAAVLSGANVATAAIEEQPNTTPIGESIAGGIGGGAVLEYYYGHNSGASTGWLIVWNSTMAINSYNNNPVVWNFLSPGDFPSITAQLTTTPLNWNEGIMWNLTIPLVSTTPTELTPRVVPGLPDYASWSVAGADQNYVVLQTAKSSPNATGTEYFTMAAVDVAPGVQPITTTYTANVVAPATMTTANVHINIPGNTQHSTPATWAWIENITVPGWDLTYPGGAHLANGGNVLITDTDTLGVWDYSEATGVLLWVSHPYENAFSMQSTSTSVGAYGLLYAPGYDGYVHALNATTGVQVWETITAPGGLEIPEEGYPASGCIVGGGVVFSSTTKSYETQPAYRGHVLNAFNAATGVKIWNISGEFSVASGILADGILMTFNTYDGKMYAFGPGQTATTVEAPLTATTAGTPLIIQGTVTDQSIGAQGTPAISDQWMTPWMEYLYMNQPLPASATGVAVSIDAIDPNGNFVHLGSATSDISGVFSLAWTPPSIPGKYTIIATFSADNSYFGSSAECATYVTGAAAATAAPTASPTSVADLYFVPAIAGLFVLIIVVAIVLALLMLRKRP